MVAFKHVCYVREEHGQPLFGVCFNHRQRDAKVFASVGSNRATVYQCTDTAVVPLQAYSDADHEENFYTCAWTYDEDTKESLLAVAGYKGVIRIIGTQKMICKTSYTGHGNAINELKAHPSDPNLLLSASKDHALRLWNLKTVVCVAIFGGVEGHRDEVLSADFNLDGTAILSSGMDHAIKLWSVAADDVVEAVERSYKHNRGESRSFGTVFIHFPLHSSRDIHRNYIDCVRWYGKLALSKSCENSISLWRPPGDDRKDFEVLHRFDVPNCEIWYIRFCLDQKMQLLALGNQCGKVMVWDLSQDDVVRTKPHTISHNKCTTAIRQSTISSDGRTLVYVCDNGTVWRWDRKD